MENNHYSQHDDALTCEYIFPMLNLEAFQVGFSWTHPLCSDWALNVRWGKFCLRKMWLHPLSLPRVGCSFCPVCEGFGRGHGVPWSRANQHVLGQQKVCGFLCFCVRVCVCACVQTLIFYQGGSTKISIIRGLCEPSLLTPAALHLPLIPSSSLRLLAHHPPPHASIPAASFTTFIFWAIRLIPLSFSQSL